MFGENANPKWALDALQDDMWSEQELKRLHAAIVEAAMRISREGSWHEEARIPAHMPSRGLRTLALDGTQFVEVDDKDSIALREYRAPREDFSRLGLFARRGEEEPALVAEFARKDTVWLSDVGRPDASQSFALENLLDTIEASPNK